MGWYGIYPLVMTNSLLLKMAHLQLIYLLKIVIYLLNSNPVIDNNHDL